jgi:hypothetical protein
MLTTQSSFLVSVEQAFARFAGGEIGYDRFHLEVEQEYENHGDQAPEVLLDIMNPKLGRIHFELPDGNIHAFSWDVTKNDFQSYIIPGKS